MLKGGMEVACQLNNVKELALIREKKYENLRQSIIILSKKIGALRRSQKERAK